MYLLSSLSLLQQSNFKLNQKFNLNNAVLSMHATPVVVSILVTPVVDAIQLLQLTEIVVSTDKTTVLTKIDSARAVKVVKNTVTSRTKSFCWMKIVAAATMITERTVVTVIEKIAQAIVPMDGNDATHALHNNDNLSDVGVIGNLNVVSILVEVAILVEDSMVPSSDYNDILTRLVTNFKLIFKLSHYYNLF